MNLRKLSLVVMVVATLICLGALGMVPFVIMAAAANGGKVLTLACLWLLGCVGGPAVGWLAWARGKHQLALAVGAGPIVLLVLLVGLGLAYMAAPITTKVNPHLRPAPTAQR